MKVHYETLPMQYTNFGFSYKFIEKNDNLDKFAQNTDFGYTLEPPNEYPQSILATK